MSIKEFAQNQLNWIQIEQKAEIEQTSILYQQFSTKQLVDKGVLLTGLKNSGLKSGIGGDTLLEFQVGVGGKEMALSENKFKVGDLVLVKQQQSGKKKEQSKEWVISGVLTRKTDSFITIAVKDDQNLDDLPDLCTLSKMTNTVSYKRMEDSLRWLEEQDDNPSDLLQVLFGKRKAEIDEVEDVHFLDETLNEAQQRAVRKCLGARHLFLIHGPPGTGKTHTCVEVIRQLVEQKKRVLVCGPSNISVDNLVERLSKLKLDLVRLGHPARILDSVLDHALDVRIHTSDEGQIVRDVRKELDSTLAQASKTKRKGDRYKLYQDAKQLRSELKTRERTVLTSTIKNAQVVLSTLNGAASKMLKNEIFDVLLIDECSQALEAESWIAIQKCKKLLLAGDHLQLPPTIQSVGKVEKALSFTLFERMIKLHGENIKELLNVQYRMHKDIMDFSSTAFYDKKLVCGPGIEGRLLTDLKDVQETDETTIPLVFIDTAGHDLEESVSDEDSKSNDGEVALVKLHVQKLVLAGVSTKDIVVISPYTAQISKIKSEIGDLFPGLELGTVDGIQGREKEVVILSLVRSNSKGQVGFLQESRRLNVALTRPKRHLCVIGDSQTLSRDSFLKKMIEYLEERAEIRYP